MDALGMMAVPVDGSDPLVAIMAWLVTMAIRKLTPKQAAPLLHKLTPILAVLLAVFFRSMIATAQGEPITLEVLLRAFAAGAAAVMGHSQLREMVKMVQERVASPGPPTIS